jgi:NADH/NAD ratio-sensing transcriptional regulator Rex
VCIWRLFTYIKLIVIIITSLVIAAKYYQEATEVVVNCDIARILHIQPYRLNQMERILVSLID